MNNENKLLVCIFLLGICIFASFCYLWKNPEVFIKLGEKEEIIKKKEKELDLLKKKRKQ